MTDQLVETASAVFTNKTTQVGGITTTGAGVISALAKIDFVAQLFLCIALCSLLITAFSFLMNWYYKLRDNQRAQQVHDLKMQLMREGKWHGQE
ncbi:phage holin family protein [Acinetobacter rathckeae]|uniref:hypothetical protein n=1 Tax=Acinetobacter rathckeae TaxID=2605272 RepID=UPI0018A2C038|nr:hypothetical protein [Acinetobacter rathckeae]MBF7687096.1 hypothetical protein [Acinetobacter rathckeae]